MFSRTPLASAMGSSQQVPLNLPPQLPLPIICPFGSFGDLPLFTLHTNASIPADAKAVKGRTGTSFNISRIFATSIHPYYESECLSDPENTKKDRSLSGNDPLCLHSRRNKETNYLAFFLPAVFLAAGFFAAAFLAAGFFAATGSSCDRALTL